MHTAEQLEIRQLARQFAEGEIRPQVARWDEARELGEEIFAKLGELGFLGMTVPEEYGGLGLDLATYYLALEALAWGDASVALSVAIHSGPAVTALRARGTPEQCARWLPSMAAGETLAAFALSEPEAGSDAGALATRAVRDGEGWRLDGTKRWVTNGDRAGLVLVFARTDPDTSGPRGIGAFLVPRRAEGYRVGARERTMGLAASETVTVHLEDVRLGPDALLGGPGDGFVCAMEALAVGRGGIAAQAVGIAQSALEHAVRYSGEREQFGVPLHRFGAIQQKLAEMATRIEGARALTLRAARLLDPSEGGTPPGRATVGSRPAATAAAMAKLAASETALFVADEAVQIFGGYGYMRDYPVEKLLRDARGTEIYEGTSEIMRHIIARDVVGGGR